MSAPSPRTWVDKEIPPYDVWNTELHDTWAFLLNPPMVKCRQTVAQPIPSGVWTAVTFDVEDTDSDNMHSGTSSVFQPNTPGWYVGYMGASFEASSAGRRLFYVRKNGVSYAGWRTDSYHVYSGSIETDLIIKGNAFGPVAMNGTTDYVEMMLFQDSGVSLDTKVGVTGETDYEFQPEFYMRWVAAL